VAAKSLAARQIRSARSTYRGAAPAIIDLMGGQSGDSTTTTAAINNLKRRIGR
jgi:hypothetical protein